jgi:hypothetical protein
VDGDAGYDEEVSGVRRGGFYLGRSICFFSVYLSVAICQSGSFGFDGGGATGERAPGGSAPGERNLGFVYKRRRPPR